MPRCSRRRRPGRSPGPARCRADRGSRRRSCPARPSCAGRRTAAPASRRCARRRPAPPPRPCRRSCRPTISSMYSPPVVADAVALLLRRLGRHVDPAVDAHRPARHREALRVIARRRAHHPGGDLLRGQLHQQVVGAAQLVRAHRLQVLALQVDLRAGDRRQPLAELQRAAQRPRRKFAERPRRCPPRTAAADVRGLWLSSADTDQWCHCNQQVIQLTGVSTNTGI